MPCQEYLLLVLLCASMASGIHNTSYINETSPTEEPVFQPTHVPMANPTNLPQNAPTYKPFRAPTLLPAPKPTPGGTVILQSPTTMPTTEVRLKALMSRTFIVYMDPSANIDSQILIFKVALVASTGSWLYNTGQINITTYLDSSRRLDSQFPGRTTHSVAARAALSISYSLNVIFTVSSPTTNATRLARTTTTDLRSAVTTNDDATTSFDAELESAAAALGLTNTIEVDQDATALALAESFDQLEVLLVVTSQPTTDPSASPTVPPSALPSPLPTVEPTPQPTLLPTSQPTVAFFTGVTPEAVEAVATTAA